MSDLIPLNYKGASVRQVEKDGATWFVATDVCGILEMKNPTKALSSLDSDEKHTLTITEGIAKDSRAQGTQEVGYRWYHGSWIGEKDKLPECVRELASLKA
jgi:prophage antirepressor-like protein